MTTLFRFLLCLLGWTFLQAPRAAGESPAPEWIWMDEAREGVSSGRLESSLPLDAGEIERATLRVTADFAAVAVEINGQAVVELEPYDPPAELDARRWLAPGGNLVALHVRGVAGPSAVAAALKVVPRQGESRTLSTGTGWTVEGGGRALLVGPVAAPRWALSRLPEVSPFAEYNQWKEALAGDGGGAAAGGESISPLPPGFEIAKVREAAEEEDSWISMAIDPKGRLIIAMEQKGLLRLTLSGPGSEVVGVEVIEDTLMECRGLAWHDGALYAHANRSKGLYRLRDTTGDDAFDEITLLVETEGTTGHGRNDLVTGPDGALHAILGDDVLVPEDSPRRARPEAGAPKELGHWARLGGEGGEGGDLVWEAKNRGLRNPYGIDFNHDGEAFTYDADNEGDVGLPFYHPTRVLHLVSGANYGWRQDRGNTRSFPLHAPDAAPGTLEVGRGSPTGVKFGGRSAFPPPWRDALFALDWSYGRVIATHLVPRGASYHGSGEIFLEGRPLNVTDLDFDAEGAMWLVTGGRKTRSALYRIRYAGEALAESAPGGQAVARAAFSAGARERRRALERFHGSADPLALDEAWPALGDPDPWLRGAARVAVEWQPVEQWRERALASLGDASGLAALLALARAGDDADRAAASGKAAGFSPQGWGRWEKLALLRVHELALTGPGPAGGDLASRVASQLEALDSAGSAPVERELARALVAYGSAAAVERGLLWLASAEDQSGRLHYLEALSEAETGWTPPRRELYFRALAHAKRFSYGDRLMAPFFQAVEESALARVPDEAERGRLASLLAEEAEEESPALPPRPRVRQWTMADFSSPEELGSDDAPDFQRGRELYAVALCSRCHVCGTEGRPMGPDLTTVARRFSRRDLLESILEPSKVVAEAHRNVIVALADGGVTMGRIIQNDFRESRLVLSTDPFQPGVLVSIPKSEIISWEDSPVSPMPPGLLDTLSREEILDLLAWIEASGPVE